MKVLLALPVYGNSMPIKTATALMTMEKPCLVTVLPLERLRIDLARSLAAQYAVDNDFDYVFFVDDDNPPTQDTLTKLLAADKDIICALIPKRTPGHDFCMFKAVESENGVTAYNHINKVTETLQEVDCIGTGVSLIKTKVFKDLIDKYQKAFMFEIVNHEGQIDTLSEDLVFSKRAKGLGYKLYCHTDVKIPHIGNTKLITINEKNEVVIK